jgi:hypothetical protein
MYPASVPQSPILPPRRKIDPGSLGFHCFDCRVSRMGTRGKADGLLGNDDRKEPQAEASKLIGLISDAAGNPTVPVVEQQVPTTIIRRHDVASVDQRTVFDRVVIQIHSPTKLLDFCQYVSVVVTIFTHIVKDARDEGAGRCEKCQSGGGRC